MSVNPNDLSALAGMYENAGALQLKEITQRYKLGKEEIGARLKIANIESKDRRYGIDAQRESEREKLALAVRELQEIGVPRVAIERFVAEKNYEIAQAEMAIKREQFVAETTGYYQGNPTLEREELARQYGLDVNRMRLDRQQLAETRRQFDVGASGYMGQAGTLTQQQQQRYQQIRQVAETSPNTLTPADLAELQQYEDILSGQAGAGQGAPTLEREELGRRYELDRLERERRYGLDVAQFGAELASTPDTYFQARRFQGVDVPRLMGGAGAATQGPTGGPTPGVATMGAYLSGQDPYAQVPAAAGGAAGAQSTIPAGAPGSAFPSPYGGAAPSYGAAQPGQWLPGQGPAPTGAQSGAFYSGAPGGGGAPAVPGAEVPGALGMPGTTEDDRARQLAAIAKASPPSPYSGLGEQDAATLRLMESIYKKGFHQIPGGELERLQSSGRMGFLRSAGTYLGYSPDEEIARYQSYRPSQGSASLA